MNKTLVMLPLALLVAAPVGFQAFAADDPVSKSEKLGDLSKEVSQDSAKVSGIQADIKTQQAKIAQDTARYGADSDQVKRDNANLEDLKKKLAEEKGDLRKDQMKKDAQSAGEIPVDSGSGY